MIQTKILICIFGVMLPFQEVQVDNVMIHTAGISVEQISLPLVFVGIPVP